MGQEVALDQDGECVEVEVGRGQEEEDQEQFVLEGGETEGFGTWDVLVVLKVARHKSAREPFKILDNLHMVNQLLTRPRLYLHYPGDNGHVIVELG